MDKTMIRDNRISYLRAIACIAIIILHTTYIANITFTDSYTLYGNIASNTARNLMLWAVPNFVMVTGALLLNPIKDISIGKVFTTYIKRIFLALLLFCIVYQVFDSIFIDKDFGISSIIKGIQEAFLGTSWSTMWYPYTLIGLYLLLPIYRMVADKAERKEMLYLLLIYALFLSIIPILRIWDIRPGFSISVSTIYPLYLFAGHAIYSGKVRITRNQGIILTIIGSILTVIFTYLRYAFDIESLEMFRDYNGINVLLQSIGIFATVFSANADDSNANELSSKENSIERGTTLISKLLISLDDNSFGIYLVHIVLIKWLFRVFAFDPYKGNAPINFAIIIIVLLLISWLITWALRLIPFMRKIL